MNTHIIVEDNQVHSWDDEHDPGSASTEITEVVGRWKARDVTYVAGKWKSLAKIIPRFSTEEFRAYPHTPPNPYLRAVVRQPVTPAEAPIPVGVVSNTYRLVQHAEVVETCFEGLNHQNIDPHSLKCEVGLSPLGEWMNFRAYFPLAWSHKPRVGDPLALRLECFNSVDGSSRLVVLLSWLRLVCSNGMVISETKAEIRDIHDSHLDLNAIPAIVAGGMDGARADMFRLQSWETIAFHLPSFRAWVDNVLADKWGKNAACRIFHICLGAVDVKITDPFFGGKPSEKPTEAIMAVPGAAKPATNLFDVSQALSWVATRRSNVEERLLWQAQIGDLIDTLAGPMPKHAARRNLLEQ